MISNMLYKQKSPYLTSKDRGEIENFIATTKARRSAFDEVKKATVPAIDKVISRMRAAYPQFAKYHVQGFEKGHRDMVLMTNMAANAMMLGEHATMDDQITEWYRTILKSVHVSPQFLKDTYTAWQEELGATLSGESWSLLRPMVEHLTNYLVNIPVPVRDEIGERKPLQPQGSNLGGKSWKS
jgi:Phycobilisome protein